HALVHGALERGVPGRPAQCVGHAVGAPGGALHLATEQGARRVEDRRGESGPGRLEGRAEAAAALVAEELELEPVRGPVIRVVAGERLRGHGQRRTVREAAEGVLKVRRRSCRALPWPT